MVVPLQAEVRPGETAEEETLRTISSRLGGGKTLQSGMPKVNAFLICGDLMY